jgi:hypothetical protein
VVVDRITTQPTRNVPYSGDWIDQSWHAEAACAESGEDMISPEEPAKLIYQYCRVCPVRLECGEEGLRYEAQYGCQTSGIWGGVFVSFGNTSRKKGIEALSVACATLRRNGHDT